MKCFIIFHLWIQLLPIIYEYWLLIVSLRTAIDKDIAEYKANLTMRHVNSRITPAIFDSIWRYDAQKLTWGNYIYEYFVHNV